MAMSVEPRPSVSAAGVSLTTAAPATASQPPGRCHYTSTRRIFRILDLVGRAGDGLTVKRLARDLGVSVSTCYQLVAILVDEGYVERLSHRAGYRLGPTIGVLFDRSRESGRDAVVERVLRDLVRIARHPAHFAVLSKSDDVVITHAHVPPDRTALGGSEGLCGPAHALAVGKVLLAAGGSVVVNRYVERHELQAFTRRTITDAAELKAHVAQVRRRGYAADIEEFARNLSCVAVPVRSTCGTLSGAVGLATTAKSSADELRLLIGFARRAAHQMSNELGREPDAPQYVRQPVPRFGDSARAIAAISGCRP
jgi:DNA-binding IclR family transcriptional regulator